MSVNKLNKYSTIPMEMKQLPNWVIACYDKKPFNPVERRYAKSNDPKTWNTFDFCLNFLTDNDKNSSFAGLGFMFSENSNLVGIDIDHCLDENGNIIDDKVNKLIQKTNSYVEKSQSGRGLHILVIGKKLFSGNKSHISDMIDIEVYDDKRYFFITGHLFDDEHRNITDGTAILDYIGKTYFTNDSSIEKETQCTRNLSDAAGVPEDVMELLEPALENDEKLNRLWSGERQMHWDSVTKSYKTDESSNDMVLLCMICPILNYNSAMIKKAFLCSPFVAGKDDYHRKKVTARKDYLDRSIEKAIEFTSRGIKPECYSLFQYDFSDDGNCERFLSVYGDRVAYAESEQCWYVYNGKFWQRDLNKSLLMKLAKEMYLDMKNALSECDDTRLKHNVAKLGNNQTKHALFKSCECEVCLDTDNFNNQHSILVVSNGVVDLRTGNLLDFSPKYHMTQAITKLEFQKDAGKPVRFLQFLDEIFASDQELINYVLIFLGYCLTGETKESIFLVCHGGGSNGKSVFFNLITHIFGLYADSMARDSLLKKRDVGRPNSGLVNVKDKRFVQISEMKSNDEFDTALLKNITGGAGERVNARALFKNEESFEISFKVVINTNHMPKIDWFDYAMVRRVRVIPFKVTIDESKKDKDLLNKLIAESEQILKLLVCKSVEYYKNGMPPVPKACTATYKSALVHDCPLKAFFEDQVIITRNAEDKIQAATFIKSVGTWCRDNGISEEEIPNQTQIGKRVKLTSGVSVCADGYHRVIYKGIKLKTIYNDDDAAS